MQLNLAVAPSNLFGAFRQGLRDLGYVDGRNVVIVDVIFAPGTRQALAAKHPPDCRRCWLPAL